MKAPRSLILTTLALSLTAIPAALASDLDRDIHRDRAKIAHDQAELRQLERKLAEENRELANARARERRDIETGHFGRAWRDAQVARREQAEVNAVRGRIAREKAEIASERTDLARDYSRRNRRDYD